MKACHCSSFSMNPNACARCTNNPYQPAFALPDLPSEALSYHPKTFTSVSSAITASAPKLPLPLQGCE